MAEAALELRAILEAAERSAAAEDFLSAERYLRQAADLQEAQLGPSHHDLANTLNNLGIVCEHLGKSADAEACYRRAYRIASTSLPPEHPLVQTSGQNLKDFCAAIGKPFEVREPSRELDTFASESSARKAAAPEPPPAPAPKPKPQPVPLIAAVPPAKPVETRAPEPPTRQPTAAMRTASPVESPSSSPIVPIAIGAVLVLALAVWWFGFRESPQPVAPVESRVETPPPAPAPPPAPVAEPEKPPATETPASPVVAADTAPRPSVKESPAPTKVAASGDVSVAEAKLCRSLSTSNWVCAPAASPAAPGAFFFYTRVKSPRDTTVQHRWLMNGRVLRSVNLQIGANSGAGYRTYSRNTVIAERRGDWTIELRDAGGALLHEERFTVQ